MGVPVFGGLQHGRANTPACSRINRPANVCRFNHHRPRGRDLSGALYHQSASPRPLAGADQRNAARQPTYDVLDWDSPHSPRRFYQAVYNPDPARLVYVPAGSFLLGSPHSEQDRESDEGPQTQVTLTRAFFMGKTEVTQSDYVSVVSNNPSFFADNPQRPVEQVTWAEATHFCALLTARERLAGRIDYQWTYRLPTEAEWEYASRAGAFTRYTFGDDLTEIRLGNYAWFDANANGAP